MLPSLTAGARHLPRVPLWRVGLGAGGIVLLLAAIAIPVVDRPVTREAPVLSLAARLPAQSWGFAVPTGWFATPLTGFQVGDRVDLLALKAADRPAAAAIAHDLEVMSIDERTMVLGVTAFDATALATARAGGQLIVPLLRSER